MDPVVIIIGLAALAGVGYILIKPPKTAAEREAERKAGLQRKAVAAAEAEAALGIEAVAQVATFAGEKLAGETVVVAGAAGAAAGVGIAALVPGVGWVVGAGLGAILSIDRAGKIWMADVAEYKAIKHMRSIREDASRIRYNKAIRETGGLWAPAFRDLHNWEKRMTAKYTSDAGYDDFERRVVAFNTVGEIDFVNDGILWLEEQGIPIGGELSVSEALAAAAAERRAALAAALPGFLWGKALAGTT